MRVRKPPRLYTSARHELRVAKASQSLVDRPSGLQCGSRHLVHMWGETQDWGLRGEG